MNNTFDLLRWILTVKIRAVNAVYLLFFVFFKRYVSNKPFFYCLKVKSVAVISMVNGAVEMGVPRAVKTCTLQNNKDTHVLSKPNMPGKCDQEWTGGEIQA